MDAVAWVIIGMFALTIVLLYIGAIEAERRYHRMHPPDDGTREVKFDDDDSGT